MKSEGEGAERSTLAQPAWSSYNTVVMTRWNCRWVVNVAVVCAVLAAGCSRKPKDPVEEIKSLIPTLETQLNRRDLAGLKRMGTTAFESNTLVIDVFGDRARDSVHLGLHRVSLSGSEATLILELKSADTKAGARELHLHLLADGRWKIDSYQIIIPSVDSVPAPGL